MRKCKFWTYEYVAGTCKRKEQLPGKFHQWGHAVNENYEEPFPETVAIVEGDDGVIREILPRDIKFID